MCVMQGSVVVDKIYEKYNASFNFTFSLKGRPEML